jgi:class 3 adenylate cyclase
MPLFIDIHELHGVTAQSVAEAHGADVQLQVKYGVEYIKYWLNEEQGKIFCLCSAPDAEAANRVHREAHGLVAERIIRVEPELAEAFLGGGQIGAAGEARFANRGEPDTGFRTVLFTDIVDSTSLTQRVGDNAAMEVIRMHDTVVRGAMTITGGREVKHTGDGIMACFLSADDAVRCAARVQSDLNAQNYEGGGTRLQVRIGAAAGEPVERHNDLFGSTVQLAARLCSAAQPGEILVSQSVIEVCADKSLPFRDRGHLALKGFEAPQPASSVDWRLVSPQRAQPSASEKGAGGVG